MILISINFFIFLAITGWLYWMILGIKKSLNESHNHYFDRKIDEIEGELTRYNRKINSFFEGTVRMVKDNENVMNDKFKGLEDKIESIKHKKK